MSTGTAFGPQGYQAATSLPAGSARNRFGAGVDTWVQDCAAGSSNGTILDAAFFNMIIGNLRTVVGEAVAAGAEIDVTDGDMTLLYQAINFLSQPVEITGNGPISVANNRLSLSALGLKEMIA